MDEKVIYDFNEQLEYLESLTELSLKTWLNELFFYGNTEPLSINTIHKDKKDVVNEFYIMSQNKVFKLRVKNHILYLFNNYNRHNISNELLYHLLWMISGNGFTEAIDKIKCLMNDNYLKECKDTCYGHTIHSVMGHIVKHFEKNQEEYE